MSAPVEIVLVYQSLLGIYGDRGNAMVLLKRLQWRGIEARLARLEKLQVWRVPSDAAQALAAMAERSMQLQATIQEGAITLSSSQGSVHVEPVRWK